MIAATALAFLTGVGVGFLTVLLAPLGAPGVGKSLAHAPRNKPPPPHAPPRPHAYCKCTVRN